MRISDWSSDVCSSDLPAGIAPLSIRSDHHLPLQQSDRIDTAGNVDLEAGARGGDRTAGRVDDERTQGVVLHLEIDLPSQQGQAALTAPVLHLEIGRASCRERVCQYV